MLQLLASILYILLPSVSFGAQEALILYVSSPVPPSISLLVETFIVIVSFPAPP